jgi:hypothetical protein
MKKKNPMHVSFSKLIQQLQTQAEEKGIAEPVFGSPHTNFAGPTV